MVDAPRFVSSDARPTRPECAVTHGRREVALSLVDDEHGDDHVQPSEYFDVQSNAWALTGFWDAWREAEAMCRVLPVERD